MTLLTLIMMIYSPFLAVNTDGKMESSFLKLDEKTEVIIFGPPTTSIGTSIPGSLPPEEPVVRNPVFFCYS